MKRTPLLTGALALALLAGGDAAATDGLGRIFFSPEQRAELDRQRQIARGRASLPDAAPRPPLSGEVRRSSGRRTLWLDGRPQHADASHGAVPLPDGVVGPSFSSPDEAAAMRPGDGRIVVHRHGRRHAR